jgi:hypothetical protein
MASRTTSLVEAYSPALTVSRMSRSISGVVVMLIFSAGCIVQFFHCHFLCDGRMKSYLTPKEFHPAILVRTAGPPFLSCAR